MLRLFLTVAAMLVLTGTLPTHVAAQTIPSSKAMHAALGGTWTGTLRYRDYQDSTRFVTLPTVIEATAAADSTNVRLDFIYDDGPGKTVRSSDTFSLNDRARVLRWGPTDGTRVASTFAVQQFSGSSTLRLIVEMTGQDDDKTARIRETITVAAGELHILKEVQFSADAPWVFRHEYRFNR